MKVIIIGGVAGGATTAARIRRLNEKAQITVYEKSGYISYANCGLPYYIGGVIEDEDDLTLQTPQSFKTRFNVDMLVNHEVISINPNSKSVTVKNLQSGETFDDSYDKLLISSGARPIRPNITGIDGDEIFTLRTVEDTLRLKSFINERKPKSAVVVGGGFIGIEMADNLRHLGIDVTLVEALNQVMAPFDADMAAFLHAELRKNGVKLALGKAVAGFEHDGNALGVSLADGTKLSCDMAVLAIGVAPDTALARQANLELGIKQSIAVNCHMQTSNPHIYAVGDAVQIKNALTDVASLIPLAGPANKQARIAADNICGGDSSYKGSIGSSVLKVFSLTAACTGINERTAAAQGIAYEKVILSPMSHAGYYPGGKVMTLKVLFEKASYRLLGAQIVGYEGVDKRIDVLATAIWSGLKGYELADLDLSYAPPYSSAKDPVNMAGFIIDNIKDGTVAQWYLEDEPQLKSNGSVTLLDTRTVQEYSRGHAEGFINIPVDELRERLSELNPSKPIYVMCQSGIRSYIATRILLGNGFKAYNFAGGYRYYSAVHCDRALIKTATPCGMDD